jgi:hypothetical protein
MLDYIRRLHELKSRDYGSNEDPHANIRASEAFGVPAWVNAMLRINDKISRLAQFVRRGWLANEGAEDSLIDIAVYSIIALLLFKERNGTLDLPPAALADAHQRLCEVCEPQAEDSQARAEPRGKRNGNDNNKPPVDTIAAADEENERPKRAKPDNPPTPPFGPYPPWSPYPYPYWPNWPQPAWQPQPWHQTPHPAMGMLGHHEPNPPRQQSDQSAQGASS